MKFILTVLVALMLSTGAYSQVTDSLKIEIVKAVLNDTTEINALPFVIADIMGIDIVNGVSDCEDILTGNEWRNIGQHQVDGVQYLTLYRSAVQIGPKNAVNNNVVTLGLKSGIPKGEHSYFFCAVRN